MADSIADQGSTPSAAPPPHEGAHYANPSSKPLQGPLGPAERDGTQRFVWVLFLMLISCVVAMGFVLGLITRQP